MPTIAVAIPALEFEHITPGQAALQGRVEVRNTAVTFPDGSTFEQKHMGTAGFFPYRRMTAAAPVEVWDEADKEWKPETSTALTSLTPKPFLFKAGEAFPWQGTVVGVGQKDKNDAPQFTKAVGNFPQYFFRAYFSATRDGQEFSGLSGPSPLVQFASLLEDVRAGLGLEPGRTIQTTGEVRLFLRNASQQVIGSVEIKAGGGGSEIVIANWNASGTLIAVVKLLASGEVRLEPAAGQKVTITGLLETEQILYQPSGGGLKRMLT